MTKLNLKHIVETMAIITPKTEFHYKSIYVHDKILASDIYVRRYVATDGYRLHLTQVLLDDDTERLEKGLFLQPEKITLTKEDKINPEQELKILNEDLVSIGDRVFRLVDYNFPDYEKVIPEKLEILNDWRILNVQHLKDALNYLKDCKGYLKDALPRPKINENCCVWEGYINEKESRKVLLATIRE